MSATRYCTATLLSLAAVGCGARKTQEAAAAVARIEAGAGATRMTVRDTLMEAVLEAGGLAAPVERAVLATRLMATVTDVLVHEGDHVARGQALLRLDARELDAKRQQVGASLADAEAMHADATRQAARMRALYADSAAPRAMLEAAETGVARATAAVSAARAGAAELAAVREYAELRAPFDGVVTKRWVDPGAMAAPGTPLLIIEDARRLRLTASVTAEAASGLRTGRTIDATVEGHAVRAVIEGVVPSSAGGVYTVNALVANGDRALLSGGAATLAIPSGKHAALVVPAAAVLTDGDLSGVRVVTGATSDLRWIKVGRRAGPMSDVLSGLRAGDQVLVPQVPAPKDGGA